MRQQNARNFLDQAKEDLAIQPFEVTGFKFTLDDGDEHFNPYTLEASTKAGFPFRDGMPVVEGFFYLSDEYEAYLEALVESGGDHPSNNDGFPWCSFDSEPL